MSKLSFSIYPFSLLLLVWSADVALDGSGPVQHSLEPFANGGKVGAERNTRKSLDEMHPADESQVGNGILPSRKPAFVLWFAQLTFQNSENALYLLDISFSCGRQLLLVVELEPVISERFQEMWYQNACPRYGPNPETW